MSDLTFSEHGEDILIHRLSLWKEHGFYIDCGAYHARKMSLTARLRLFGWRGLNIDIDEDIVKSLQKDIAGSQSIQAALGELDDDPVIMYKYEDAVLNTTNPKQQDHLKKIEKDGNLFTSFKKEIPLKTRSLRSLISDYKPLIENIDFISIDVEGVELSVLRGFPWEKHRPSVIAVEIHKLNMLEILGNPVVEYLYSKDYILQSYVFHNAIFCLNSFDVELCHRVSAKKI